MASGRVGSGQMAVGRRKISAYRLLPSAYSFGQH